MLDRVCRSDVKAVRKRGQVGKIDILDSDCARNLRCVSLLRTWLSRVRNDKHLLVAGSVTPASFKPNSMVPSVTSERHPPNVRRDGRAQVNIAACFKHLANIEKPAAE